MPPPRRPGTLRGVVGEVIAGRYRLDELVGTGGMSSVYRAVDSILERPVALKLLHPQYLADDEHVERFRREARAVAQLSHPNIVTVIDRGEDDGRQYIVFEYVDGENLKEFIGREGALRVDEALDVAIEVGRGLAFAHHHGLVHRDVKPQNVLLNGDGRPKVTDFGIARSLDVEHGFTQTGTIVGTSNYIAPEQASGRSIGPSTDVYSLGVVLYELLTGDVPFPGESFVAVALRHINEPPPSVLDRRPDVPPRLAAAVERALAKDPGDRFASMDEFIDELEACRVELDGGPEASETMILAPATAPAPTPPRAPRTAERHPRPAPPFARRRRPRVWPALLLLLGAAAIAVVAFASLRAADDEGEGGGGGGGGGAAAVQPVTLVGRASHDPHGDDGQEHPEDVALATDGDPSTYWPTQTYQDFSATKPGVGLVLDAGTPRELSSVTVTTDTPGFRAEIQAGDNAGGPFRRVSPSLQVRSRTTFPIRGGRERRYYVVWITDLDGNARVNEVTAKPAA